MWDKVKDTVDVFAKILLPVVLYWVGTQYAAQQKQHDEERADFDKITLVVQQLASDKPRERVEALRVLNFFVVQCKFPTVLVPAVQDSTKDDDQRVVQTAEGLLADAIANCPDDKTIILADAAHSPQAAAAVARTAEAQPALVKSIDFTKLPGTIFIHIESKEQVARAEEVERQLEQSGSAIPSIRLVDPARFPRNSQIRYFHPADKAEAEKIVQSLGQIAVSGVQTQEKPEYAQAMPSRRYELWLSP